MGSSHGKVNQTSFKNRSLSLNNNGLHKSQGSSTDITGNFETGNLKKT